MLKKIAFALLVSLYLIKASVVNAAAPITHAYLTHIFFKQFPKYTKEEESEFMVGTLFPDIRYLGEVSRTDTHYDEMSLEEVLSETNPFLAGVKFHCYVDIVREDLVVKENLYDKLREKIPNNTSSFLKLAEDEVLYYQGRWDEICCSLVQTHPGEKKFGISERTITKWHKLLTVLFISSPSKALNMLAHTGKGAGGVTPEEVQMWNKSLKPLSAEPLIQDWIKKMVAHFDSEYALYKFTHTPSK